MESIGKVVSGMMAKLERGEALQPTPSGLPAVRPAILDREADFEIPHRVWSSWMPANGPRHLRRALTVPERAAVERRVHELIGGLRPFEGPECDRVDAAISAMLGGFRSMRQTGDDVEATIIVLRSVLREFPAWAICEGCRRIATNQAGLDPKWPPNDTQVHSVVAGVVATFRKTLRTAQGLLDAPIEPPPTPRVEPPLPTAEEMKRQAALLNMPRWQRVQAVAEAPKAAAE